MTRARAYGKAARRHVAHRPFEHLATAHQEAAQRDAAADKLSGKLIPVRFAPFVLVRLTTLWITLDRLGFEFAVAQAAATVVAMTSNFVLNNLFTYRDRRPRGLALVRGLGVFYLICTVGAVANVGVASFAFTSHYTWWLAGVAGAVVGSVWNLAMSSVFTWRGR